MGDVTWPRAVWVGAFALVLSVIVGMIAAVSLAAAAWLAFSFACVLGVVLLLVWAVDR